MNKKRAATVALAGALVLASTIGLTACGNKNIWDMNYTLRYVVVEENGQSVLHTIESWTDSESESVTFRTSCCENYIWTSANNSVLYESKPAEYAYDIECQG